MTTLHIIVGDRAQLREDTLEFIQQAESPAFGATEDRAVIQFGSYDDLVDSLTPLRLELLRAIVRECPASIREVARILDRDVSDVHGDIKHLEVIGMLELEEGGSNGAMRPVVPFENIEMNIDYPLLDDGDSDEPAATAD